jgi:hypothetical protein
MAELRKWSDTKYRYSTVKAYATLDGVPLDISAFNITYGLNSIPQASLLLPAGTPVGKNTIIKLDTGGAVSTAPTDYLLSPTYQKSISIVSNVIPAQGNEIITLEGTQQNSGTLGSVQNSNEVMVFNGYVKGLAMERTGTTLGVNASALHWVLDLASMSIFDQRRVPAAAWDVTLSIADPNKQREYKDASNVERLSILLTESLKGTTVTQDLGSVLVNALKFFASGRATTAATGNNLITQALNNIRHSLIFNFEPTANVRTSILQQIAITASSLLEGSNAWEGILALGQLFQFSVIPLVNKIAMIPIAPLYQVPATVLSSDQYSVISAQYPLSQIVRGLVMVQTSSAPLGSSKSQTPIPKVGYALSLDPNVGVLDAAVTPPWLQDIITVRANETYANAVVTGGIRGRGGYKGFEQFVNEQAEYNKITADLQIAQNLGTSYAKTLLYQRLFGGSVCNIVGPYRTDIGPGTIVGLETPDGNTLIGLVAQVTLGLNCQSASASTSFTLSHLRNSVDNDKIALKTGPIYKSLVNYVPLILAG